MCVSSEQTQRNEIWTLQGRTQRGRGGRTEAAGHQGPGQRRGEVGASPRKDSMWGPHRVVFDVGGSVQTPNLTLSVIGDNCVIPLPSGSNPVMWEVKMVTRQAPPTPLHTEP